MKDFEHKFEWNEVKPLPQQSQSSLFPILNLFIPLLIAALFFLWGKIVLAVIVASIGALLFLLHFLAPVAHQSLLALAAAFGKWLGKVISYSTLTVVYAFIFTPVAAVSRLLRRDPLNLKWRPASQTYWMDSPDVDSVRFFDKPFLLENRARPGYSGGRRVLRIGKAVYRTAVTLFLLNLAAGWIYEKVSLKLVAGTPDHRQFISVYDDANWARDYFREFHESDVLSYEPFLAWAREDYSGQHVNVENGVRKTYNPGAEPPAALELYAFGGSTMWGIGSRDEHTIPSYLSKLAEAHGMPLKVSNYAEKAYVNWQEVVRLSELCAQGDIPDLVIFLDGANDIYTKLQNPDMSRVHMNVRDFRRRFEKWHPDHHIGDWLRRYSMVHKIAGRLGVKLVQRRTKAQQVPPAGSEETAEAVVDIYRENVEFVRSLARQYGFQVWFFWQPMVTTKADRSEEEKKYTFAYKRIPEVNDVSREMISAEQLAVDLSDVFDDHPETLYIDWVHLGEEGNRIVAQRIYQHIEPTLEILLNSGPRDRHTNGTIFSGQETP